MELSNSKKRIISDIKAGVRRPVVPAATHTPVHAPPQRRPKQYVSEVIMPSTAQPAQPYARFYRQATATAQKMVATKTATPKPPVKPATPLALVAVTQARVVPAAALAEQLPTYKPDVSPPKKQFKSPRFVANIVIVVAIAMSALLGFMSYRYHIALQKVEAHPLEQQDAAAQPVASDGTTVAAGVDEKPAAATPKGGGAVVKDVPYKLTIPKLNVSAYIIGVGTTKAGAMAVPGNIWQVGWDKSSAKPVENKGVVIVNGHVHGPTIPGVFADLKKLKAGDAITLNDGSGTAYTYKVVSSQSFKAGEAEANVHQSASPNKQGLNLITCTGEIKNSEYQDRLVVYAERV